MTVPTLGGLTAVNGAAGSFSGVYKVTWTDKFGAHSLNVPITGTGG